MFYRIEFAALFNAMSAHGCTTVNACLNWLQALSANGLDTSRVPGLSHPT